jgi:hypothetical protein
MRLTGGGCLAVFILAAVPTCAREWQSEYYRCAVELPESWQERHEECRYPIALAAADSAGKRFFYAIVFRPDERASPLPANSYAAFEEGVLRGAGGTKESGRSISWLDHPAYEFSYSVLGPDGTKETALCRVVKIGELMYCLKVMSMGNLADDQELAGMCTSFRLIAPTSNESRTWHYLAIAVALAIFVLVSLHYYAYRRRVMRLRAEVMTTIKHWADAGFSATAGEEQIRLAGGPQVMVDKLLSYVQLGGQLAPDKASAVRLLSLCGRDGILALGKLALWEQPEEVHSAATEALKKISGEEASK